MRFRFWRRHHHEAKEADPVEAAPRADERQVVVELDDEQLRQMSAVFAAPRWLRDLGLASWFLVGVAALLVGLTWMLGVTSTIVDPVIVGGIVATVASPAVSWLKGHGVPRGIGALLVLLVLLALAVVILLLVLGGLTAESGKISAEVNKAVDQIQAWIQDVGVDSSAAKSANSNVSSAVPQMIHTFVNGVANGISALTSLAFGVSFTIFSIFFLLKDGPALRAWTTRHLGVPRPVGETITGGVVRALRRYFLGVTIVAAFNAVVVGLAAVLLDVPLAGTIAVVTFVTAYVPFIGAVVAGAFAVLLALGSQGTTTALIMLVVVILANGMLQNIVQPVAMGATLRMNPLLILVVTISAGAFFGMVGMVLAAPLTSAAIHISEDLRKARSTSESRGAPPGLAEQPG